MEHQQNAQQRIEGFKNRNGCENRVSEKPRQTYRNINFHTCFCNHLDLSFNQYLSIHDNYTKNHLPFSGGYLEQPNKVMEIINLISTLRSESERREQEKAKRKR